MLRSSTLLLSVGIIEAAAREAGAPSWATQTTGSCFRDEADCWVVGADVKEHCDMKANEHVTLHVKTYGVAATSGFVITGPQGLSNGFFGTGTATRSTYLGLSPGLIKYDIAAEAGVGEPGRLILCLVEPPDKAMAGLALSGFVWDENCAQTDESPALGSSHTITVPDGFHGFTLGMRSTHREIDTITDSTGNPAVGVPKELVVVAGTTLGFFGNGGSPDGIPGVMCPEATRDESLESMPPAAAANTSIGKAALGLEILSDAPGSIMSTLDPASLGFVSLAGLTVFSAVVGALFGWAVARFLPARRSSSGSLVVDCGEVVEFPEGTL